MILKFDKPITIDEARELYNDKVKFLSSVNAYPNIIGIEFNTNPQHIFKRKRIEPRITRKANKILERYSKRIETIWDETFSSAIRSLGPRKEEKLNITERDREFVKDILDSMVNDMRDEAKTRYAEAFKLGKVRGQILTNQEVDDEDLSTDEQKVINEHLDRNEEYLAAFSADIQENMDRVMTEQPYFDIADLEAAVKEKVQEPKKSRARMYAMAALGLITAGMVWAMSQADEEEGHRKIRGGFWTIHPEEGQGGVVCDGCLANSSKWFTIEEFEREYQTNNCLTRCRCDLDLL